MKKILALISVFCLALGANAQSKDKETAESMAIPATQNFRIEVFETTDDEGLVFDNPQAIRKRGLFSDIWKAMRSSYGSTLSGQVASTSTDILSSSINLIVEALRSKKNDWLEQARKDCKFTKTLPLPVEIHDFYSRTTSNGAMDPDGILFDGFGCSQYYTVRDAEGNETQVPALYVKCRLKKDEDGKNRILHHGKFEVYVEKFYFNPYKSNIPNDSLKPGQEHLRTPFDFDRRKNLKVNLNAAITSSWMNEAIQIVNDQELGAFNISVTIPTEDCLVQSGPFKGWYVYDAEREDITPVVKPVVKGECFVVPRSFIGTADGNNYERIWGTGQYKINMELNLSCEVDMDYYYETPSGSRVKGGKEPKWNDKWKDEWSKMKKRRRTKGFWNKVADNVLVNYQNNKWVYTITEPIQNVLLSKEQAVVNDAVNSLFGLSGTTVPAKGKP